MLLNCGGHRERLGLSQRSLARRAGTTQAAVSRIERGLTTPTWETVRALLAVAGRDHLISMKRASGRPVDLDDLAALTELSAGED